MTRQHATPLLLSADGSSAAALTPLSMGAGPVDEATIQRLVHEHPGCLPIAEIDPLFAGAVPICTELGTAAGPVDNLLITPSGLPVLVECKLWRNPEGRREVVGQILDYAKELSRWTSSDLQREVSRRLKREGNAVLDLVRAAGHAVDEIAFNDAVTLNLRRGRFLLLIVGDGIREGVEAIAEYLGAHAGLHFTLGLVELPIFTMPGGARLVAPRVVARTTTIRREVVALPEGFGLLDEQAADEPNAPADSEVDARRAFLATLVSGFTFSDPEQAAPRPTPKGFLYTYLPAPGNNCWITVSLRPGQIGPWATSRRGTAGDAALTKLAGEPEVVQALGGSAEIRESPPGRYSFADWLAVNPFGSLGERQRGVEWLRDRLDHFVSVLRPRIRAAVADLTGN